MVCVFINSELFSTETPNQLLQKEESILREIKIAQSPFASSLCLFEEICSDTIQIDDNQVEFNGMLDFL